MTKGQMGWRNYGQDVSRLFKTMGYNLEDAYFATASLMVDKTVASSFIRCGLLPVFSSCSITPVTMSSLIPFVSILLWPSAPGEGGGVCSYAFLPLLLGRSAKETTLAADEAVDDLGRDGEFDDVEFAVCDRLTFFVGG